jgi:GNAT superfamily N-acetyltransferase
MKNKTPYDILASTEQEIEFIDNKIAEFNKSRVPFTQKETRILKNYVIKDGSEIIAGINAWIIYWGILYVDVLYVNENHRLKKLGSVLLQKVENEAQNMGATLAHLDTLDFQAKDFYIKQGYEVFGVLENCARGFYKEHKLYSLKKNL